jgi:dihydrofolate reductase
MDGFIEGPNRELNWVLADDELHDFYTQLLQEADLMLYGRVTYELMVSYWPQADSDPNATPAMKRFAKTLNPMQKIVFSRTLKNPGWNTQVMNAVNPQDIQVMKAQPGNNILLSGGAGLARAFISHGLVDEYQLLIQPTAIRQGKALFGGLKETVALDFMGSQRLASGVVALCYRPNGKG